MHRSCTKLIQGLCKIEQLDAAAAVDVFSYTLDNNFKLMPRVCNYLLSSPAGYGVDSMLRFRLLKRLRHRKRRFLIGNLILPFGGDGEAHLRYLSSFRAFMQGLNTEYERLDKNQSTQSAVVHGMGTESNMVEQVSKHLWFDALNTSTLTSIERLSSKLELEIAKRNPDFQVMKKLKTELAEAYKQEELFWRQKCREQWLRKGDKNTIFFHNSVKGKKIKNKVIMLQNESGTKFFSEGAKGNLAVDYYKELFLSTNPHDLETLFADFESRITPEMNVSSSKILNKAEEDATIWFEVNFPKENTPLAPTSGHVTAAPWMAPPPDFLKCNIGVSWLSDQTNCGAAWILHDTRGNVLMHSRRSYSFVQSQEEAELLATFWAVDCLKTMRFTKIIFQSSFKRAHERLQSYNPALRSTPHIAQDIITKLQQMQAWSLDYVVPLRNVSAMKISESVTSDHRYQSYISKGSTSWLQHYLATKAQALLPPSS
ncbi:hypothetical protein DY000_02061498 [Brassica cretica]|uniref:RNase H type-1 domain-containing protein n=1 Tax=Brassica cretica TaxID=69181 RepID=A0ABQ7AYH6_BRACR|nr:hypothetical protein DY000_02061498 [Brassica cretica]